MNETILLILASGGGEMQPDVHIINGRLIRCLACLLALVLAGGLLLSGEVSAQQEEKKALSMLQERLTRITGEEASLRRALREGVQLATRPYADYLLHQKSLQLAGKTDRLGQLKQEKMEVIRQLAGMEDHFDPEIGIFRWDEESKKMALASTYSGAPLLSFNQAIRVDSEDHVRLSPSWIGFFRVVFLGYVMLIFTLPLVAIQKRRVSLSRERGSRTLRVFPLLTVERLGGACELLCLPVKAGIY